MRGGWGDWSSWSDCSVSCGTGSKHRNRQCDRPKPAHGGVFCSGNNTEQRICDEAACFDGKNLYLTILDVNKDVYVSNRKAYDMK